MEKNDFKSAFSWTVLCSKIEGISDISDPHGSNISKYLLIKYKAMKICP